jgi:hypothetical protein
MTQPNDRAEAGLGTPHQRPRFGFGCPSGSQSPVYASICQMLDLGSPRLALAKARGVPLAPFLINVRAKFPDTSTVVVPDVGSDVKITQDTVIDAMMVRIFNESQTANQNQFQAQSDWYFNWQSGIEATLDVQGAPRFTIAEKFMPLASLFDAFNGDSKWGSGFVLQYQQQLFMSFNAKITLPYAPLEVVCSFRGWTPIGQAFTRMDNRTALDSLEADFGFEFSEAYKQQALSYG